MTTAAERPLDGRFATAASAGTLRSGPPDSVGLASDMPRLLVCRLGDRSSLPQPRVASPREDEPASADLSRPLGLRLDAARIAGYLAALRPAATPMHDIENAGEDHPEPVEPVQTAAGVQDDVHQRREGKEDEAEQRPDPGVEGGVHQLGARHPHDEQSQARKQTADQDEEAPHVIPPAQFCSLPETNSRLGSLRDRRRWASSARCDWSGTTARLGRVSLSHAYCAALGTVPRRTGA